MLRTLLNTFVLVMLLFQGVAQASVEVLPHSSSMHCADHEPERSDCPCCGDNWLGMAGGCATSCTVFAAMPQQTLAVAQCLPQASQPNPLHWQPGPDYLPLTPPPIS